MFRSGRLFHSPKAMAPAFLGFLVLFLTWPLPLSAQTREKGPIVLELPASTRALALGNSFALGFSDSDAVFYHPGLLNRAQGFAGSMHRYGSTATLTTLSASTGWLSGGVTLGVQHLSYGAQISEMNASGSILQLPADYGSLRDHGDVGVSELVVSAGYGRTVKGIRMGVVGKVVEERFGPGKAATGAVDFGLVASPGPVTVGLALQNLGSDMVLEGEDIPLPLRVSLGASTQAAQVGPLDVSASGAIRSVVDGDVIPSVGLEVGYWPVTGRTFVGRIGFRHLPDDQSASPLTFGGGFIGDDIVLDYAYEGFDTGSPTHRLSVGWR